MQKFRKIKLLDEEKGGDKLWTPVIPTLLGQVVPDFRNEGRGAEVAVDETRGSDQLTDTRWRPGCRVTPDFLI